jgi:hypothetical protein
MHRLQMGDFTGPCRRRGIGLRQRHAGKPGQRRQRKAKTQQKSASSH